MRVRVLKSHASAAGPKLAKRKGDEFTMKAADAERFIAAGLLSEVKPSGDKDKG